MEKMKNAGDIKCFFALQCSLLMLRLYDNVAEEIECGQRVQCRQMEIGEEKTVSRIGANPSKSARKRKRRHKTKPSDFDMAID